MRYLHTMVRVADLPRSLEFYCGALGMVEIRRSESEKGRYTLVYLAAPRDEFGSPAKRCASARIDVQLGRRDLHGRTQFRSSRLRRRRHLRNLRVFAVGGRDNQPPAS